MLYTKSNPLPSGVKMTKPLVTRIRDSHNSSSRRYWDGKNTKKRDTIKKLRKNLPASKKREKKNL